MAFNAYKKDTQVDANPYASTSTGSGSPSMSFLGKTLEIKGEIKSDEYLTVEGKIQGNINVSKTLTIGKDGYVDGEIKADEVKIHGKAEGKITANSRLEISSRGNFSGSIKSEKLVIEEGAVFKGKVNADD
jgi:cytoskeletal protein CcmA (bactofilin family)